MASTLLNPYQIYSEISNAGKTVQGTKKRVKWRFGWSNENTPHEVDFVHSVVSGKKSIYENGKIITQATSSFSSDFGHGWNSISSPGHIFRIEANIGVTDSVYVFSIDGVAFMDFPREPVKDVVKVKKAEPARVNESEKKKVVTTKQNADEWGDSFDDRNQNQSNRGGDHGFSSDPFDDNTSFKSPSKKVSPRANVDSFDADPFASSASIPVPSQNNNNHSHQVKVAPAPAPVAVHKPAVQQFNGFDDAPMSNPASTKKGAQDYLGDFASLQPHTNVADNLYAQINDPFAPKAVIVPTPMNTGVSNTKNTNTNLNNSFVAPESKDIIDVATKSLVSLDLNKAPPASYSGVGMIAAKSREDEYKKNMSLNSLLGNAAPHTAVMTSAPVIQAPPPMKVMSSSEAISSMGARPPPMMMMAPPMAPMGNPGYGGMMGQPGMMGMPNNAYGNGYPSGGMGGGMQNNMGGQMNAFPVTNSFPSTSKPNNNNNNNTNSLDTLNWKM